jgi:glycosyltransferase involved in cell wall biosynthesis
MAGQHTFGLCMIVRDAADTISRILEGSQTIWDQIVVVDTGSVDGTLELLHEQFPFVEVYNFEWCFDFAKARNYALSLMQTDTWMWLDSDDTYKPKDAAEWRRIALEMAQANVPGSYIALPYFYRVDEREEPLIVQHRERIFLGTGDEWEWQGPVHEACIYIGSGNPRHNVHAYPVLHKPTRTEEFATERNIDILEKAYESGDRAPRTLYYLMKLANGRRDAVKAISFGKALIEARPGDVLEYEAGVGMGYAQLTAFRNTGKIDEWKDAVRTLSQAITLEPRRNEARTLLIEAYVDAKQYDRALAEANSLTVDMPQTAATLEMSMYKQFKFETIANIHLTFLNEPETAWKSHLDAMRSSQPSALSKATHRRLLKHIEDNNVAVVFIDGPSIDDNTRKELLDRGFSTIWVSNHPSARQFVRLVGPRGFYLQQTSGAKA